MVSGFEEITFVEALEGAREEGRRAGRAGRPRKPPRRLADLQIDEVIDEWLAGYDEA